MGATRWSAPAATAGREILLAALASFLGIAIVAPLALIVVIRRFERDLRSLEAAASHLEDRQQAPPHIAGCAGQKNPHEEDLSVSDAAFVVEPKATEATASAMKGRRMHGV